MKRTISGQLTELVEKEEPTVRRNIAFFGAAGPAIVQVSSDQLRNGPRKIKSTILSPTLGPDFILLIHSLVAFKELLTTF